MIWFSLHCKRDWGNSGAKQEFSQLYAGNFFPRLFQLYAGKILALCWENPCLVPEFHQSRLQRTLRPRIKGKGTVVKYTTKGPIVSENMD